MKLYTYDINIVFRIQCEGNLLWLLDLKGIYCYLISHKFLVFLIF